MTDPAGDARNNFGQSIAAADIRSFDITTDGTDVTFTLTAVDIRRNVDYYIATFGHGGVGIDPGGTVTYRYGAQFDFGPGFPSEPVQAVYDQSTNTVSATFTLSEVNGIESRNGATPELTPETVITGSASATATRTGFLGIGGDAKDRTDQSRFTLGG